MTFNDENLAEYNAHIIDEPEIPSAERDLTEISVPGRDGVLIEDNGRYNPISITLSFGVETSDDWDEETYQFKRWLTGSGNLSLSDGYFYKVLYTTIGEAERDTRFLTEIEVTFTCEPYTYLESGTQEYDYEDVLSNPYEICHPIYIITGVGTCTLTVNGNEITAYVTSNLTIDTERMVAYTSDGTVSNTSVSGNYDELYLESGENTIEITSGYSLTVIPNWRIL